MGMLPYSEWYSADFNPNALDPRKVFENHRGAEITAIEAFSQVAPLLYL